MLAPMLSPLLMRSVLGFWARSCSIVVANLVVFASMRPWKSLKLRSWIETGAALADGASATGTTAHSPAVTASADSRAAFTRRRWVWERDNGLPLGRYGVASAR